MTDTNTTNLWPSATGILRSIEKGEGKKGPFARFKIEIAKKDGSGVFTKRCIAFGEQIAMVEALGEGTRIRARGPEDSSSFVGKDGKNVTLKTIIAKTVVAQPVAVAAEAEAPMAAAA